MLTIRSEQMAALEKWIDKSRARAYAARLKSDNSVRTDTMTDKALLDLVTNGVANAQDLEIIEDEDVYRFLRLFFLPEKIRMDERVQSILIRILTNTALTPSQRIDFVEKNIISRDIDDLLATYAHSKEDR